MVKKFSTRFYRWEKTSRLSTMLGYGKKQTSNNEKILSRRLRIEQQSYDLDKNIDNKNFELLTLSLSNTCNLACRICGPAYSSKWISLKKQFENTSTYPTYNWIKNNEYINDLYEHTKNAVLVEFPGGEPLLIDTENHFKLLEKWIEAGHSKNINLNYTTNMTLFPKKEWWDIWTKFKSVVITGSCDDIEKRYEYNRYPAVWMEVYEHIKKYKEKTKSVTNFTFMMNCTISIFTFLRVHEIFKFGIQNGLEPIWNFLDYPFYFNPGVLYPHYENILEKYENTKILKRILTRYQTDYSNLLTFTKKEIEKIDSQRGQNFKETFPELAEYLY